jgi:hypothetical protein
VVVLAFTSYDQSRAGAETEALTLAQQFEVAASSSWGGRECRREPRRMR